MKTPLSIRIGTIVSLQDSPKTLNQIHRHGFEGFQLVHGAAPLENIQEIAARVEEFEIHALGCYGNTLTDERIQVNLESLIRHAHLFRTNIVSCFAGALNDRPVDENIGPWRERFLKLGKLASDHGVTLAFENCPMGGTWQRPEVNIAHSPRAWEMMFNELPDAPIGLEWEPCHQICSFVDPVAQLRKWLPKIVRMHGKDAQVHHDRLREIGILSGEYAVYHRFPGLGDTDWKQIFTVCAMAGWSGAIDIEGHHDPVFRGELEMTGQVTALRYLQLARGGDFIPNPV